MVLRVLLTDRLLITFFLSEKELIVRGGSMSIPHI